MAGNFQVDDIILHLKELRQEKLRNDQALKNLQQERKQLEKKVEAVSFQHTLVKEKSERSLDRLEVAEKKLEQFAQQQRILEEGNEVRRREVAALNATLERETVVWGEDCRDFEERLAELAAKLRSARTSFTEESLEKEQRELENKLVALKENMNVKESTQKSLSTELERLREEAEESDSPWAEVYSVPSVTWILTRDLLLCDQKKTDIRLKALQERVDKAEETKAMLVDTVQHFKKLEYGVLLELLGKVNDAAIAVPTCLQAERAEE